METTGHAIHAPGCSGATLGHTAMPRGDKVDATMLLPFGFDDGATLSEDRKYRYRLWRSCGARSREHRCAFLMVNPSTADETEPDHTVRKCVGFAKRWGFGAVDIVNLFAWRSRDVTALLRVQDPVGPDNDRFIGQVLGAAHRVVYAWGKHNAAVRRLVRERTTGWLRRVGL